MPKIKSKTKIKTAKKTQSVKVQKSKRTIVKKVKAKKTKLPAAKGLQASMYDISGKSQGSISLPKEIFGVKPNKNLLSLAVHVYFANQSTHRASTKTRAQIRGGGAKPHPQKGTGRARAGTIRSPLWVGGGVTFGPHPRDVKLNLPQKIKRKALIYALSKQREDGRIKVISNFDKMEAKTKMAASLFKKLAVSGKTLLILEDKNLKVKLAVRNIPEIQLETVANLNAFKVLANQNLLMSQAAIDKFKV